MILINDKRNELTINSRRKLGYGQGCYSILGKRQNEKIPQNILANPTIGIVQLYGYSNSGNNFEWICHIPLLLRQIYYLDIILYSESHVGKVWACYFVRSFRILHCAYMAMLKVPNMPCEHIHNYSFMIQSLKIIVLSTKRILQVVYS